MLKQERCIHQVCIRFWQKNWAIPGVCMIKLICLIIGVHHYLIPCSCWHSSPVLRPPLPDSSDASPWRQPGHHRHWRWSEDLRYWGSPFNWEQATSGGTPWWIHGYRAGGWRQPTDGDLRESFPQATKESQTETPQSLARHHLHSLYSWRDYNGAGRRNCAVCTGNRFQ